jgi:hypothetical protein
MISPKAANSLMAFWTLECRGASNPALQYASTYRCTVARDSPTISAAFWQVTPQCRSQIDSILFRTRRLERDPSTVLKPQPEFDFGPGQRSGRARISA